MFRPASKSTLHDNILAQLVASIKAGQWQPGGKLPGEQELARSFQVSRNCIREVLKALALAGVVASRPGQGTFLTPEALIKLDGGGLVSSVLGDASLGDLIEMRRLLEGHAAYLAAQQATPEALARLEHTLQAREPQVYYPDSDFRFHTVLASLSGNELLRSLLESVQERLDILREQYKKLPGSVVREFDCEHRDIYEKIRDGDAKGAREALVRHIDDAWMDVLYLGMAGNSGTRRTKHAGDKQPEAGKPESNGPDPERPEFE